MARPLRFVGRRPDGLEYGDVRACVDFAEALGPGRIALAWKRYGAERMLGAETAERREAIAAEFYAGRAFMQWLTNMAAEAVAHTRGADNEATADEQAATRKRGSGKRRA